MTDPLDGTLDVLVDSGLELSPPDDRDWPLEAAVPIAAELVLPARFPVAVDWPPSWYNQGTNPYCVGATGGAGSTIATEGARPDLVARFDFVELYARCKEVDGLPAGSAGTTMRALMRVLRDRGARLVDPERIGGSRRVPIDAYTRLDGALRELKVAVYTTGSALVATRWYRNWNRAGVPSSGILPAPKDHYINHAWTVVGWNDTLVTPAGRGALRMRNSFGRAWGDSGYGWLPYQYLSTVLREAWQIVMLGEPEPPPPPPPEPPTSEDPMPLAVHYDPLRVGDIPAGTVIRKVDAPSEKLTSLIEPAVAARLPAEAPPDRWFVVIRSRHFPGGTAASPIVGLGLVDAAAVANVRQAPADSEAAARRLAALVNLSIAAGELKRQADEALAAEGPADA